MMSNNQETSANGISEARTYLGKKQFEQALAACDRAIEADPHAYEAYGIRWTVLSEMMAPDETRAKMTTEVEAFLNTHPETPEVLHTAYWGYMEIPGRTQNVPQSLFDKMLQHPGTNVALLALLGLAERSQDPREKWEYNRRIIDEFTADIPDLTWYWGAYQDMLRLVEQNRSLASDDYLDELIERCLQTHLTYCRKKKSWFHRAYQESVIYRLKLGIRLDKALETLEPAEMLLQKKEFQEWVGSMENLMNLQKEFTRLRGEIHLKQERWKEAYEALQATTSSDPDYLNLVDRFGQNQINLFFSLGRALEGLGEFDQAIRYYTDVYFSLDLKSEAHAGLQRIYQAQHGNLDQFENFLKALEAEYRIREAEEREIIRQNLIKKKLDKEAPGFTLKTLDGETYTLSEMHGKVVLLDVWTSSCVPCIKAFPEVEKVYEHFRTVDDVVILGVNSGEHPEKVRAFLLEHKLPWPILIDRHREVHKAYKIEGIPTFVLVDKTGRWQYTRLGYTRWVGQELIWLIDALRMVD